MNRCKGLTNSLTRWWILSVTLACLYASPAAADSQALPAPESDSAVLLKIAGQLSKPNKGDEVWLDLKTLESLPSTTFITETPWSSGPQTFTGVRLNTLLELVGAAPDMIDAVAIDNYQTTMQNVDFSRYPVILAYRQNGKPMTIRNLGPLRIIFPFTDHPELWTESNETYSVWQLTKLTLR